LLAAAPAAATLYTVNLGATNVVSDSGISLSDWGQAESGGGAPGRPEGGYGGIGTGNCRMAWGHNTSGDNNDWAKITFPEAVVSVTIRHLDGSAGDSFDVIVDGVFWGHYKAHTSGETWETTVFNAPDSAPSGGSVVTIDITDNATIWRADWGQLGIDWVEAETVPEPATLVLLGLGALVLRKRK